MDTPAYISSAPEGVRIRVRIKPGARSDRLVAVHGDALKVDVKAQPERGRANQAVCHLFAELLGASLRDVQIATGGTSQNKTILVIGADLGSAAAAIAERLRT